MRSDADKIERLERELALVRHQISGMPVRLARSSVASASNNIRKARVISTISAATGAAAADWGSGTVQLKDDTTGLPDGSTVDCDNEWPNSWVADCQVSVNTSYSPYRVEGGTCAAENAVTYWGD